MRAKILEGGCSHYNTYVHMKTYMYCLNKWIKVCHSCGVQQVLILTKFRYFPISMLICWCDNVELWVLALTDPLKWFYKSYNFSNDTTPFGMGFSLFMRAASCTAFSCSSSSINTSLNTLVLDMKCSICFPSLKKHKLVILLGSNSLKGISTEKLSLSADYLVVAFANAPTTALHILRTYIILKGQN